MCACVCERERERKREREREKERERERENNINTERYSVIFTKTWKMTARNMTIGDASHAAPVNGSVRKKNLAAEKSRVFSLRIMGGFPQELETMRFNSEPKRYKSVSLSAKRSVLTLVCLGHGVVTEKLRFPYQ